MKPLHVFLIFFCFTLGIDAQILFEQVPPPLPAPQITDEFDGVAFGSIAFADIDGDNDPDVLITGDNSSSQRIAKLYTNDGNGGFTEVTGTPFDGVDNGSIAFADIDGDNDPDVLITGFSSGGIIAKLYTNDGSGGYTEVTGTPFDGVLWSSIAFADIDGDNDPDVLITGLNAGIQSIAKLYTNDGSGGYTEVIGTALDGVWLSSIAFADIDGDNDSDVLITGQNSIGQYIAKLYTNDGSGGYTEVTGIPFEGVRISSIAFADIDGDNDPDVLITGLNAGNQPIAKLYTNNGSGVYTEVTGTVFDEVRRSSIAFADVDGDNDLDVLITGDNSGDQRIAKLYTNDGSGGYTEVTGTPFDGVELSSIAFADIDGDNDPDVLITGVNSSDQRIAKLYRNTTALPCVVPSNLSASNITNNSAELSWDASSGETDGYDYLVQASGTAPPDATTTPTGNVDPGITTASLTGLTVNTAYDVYVRTNCGSGNLSDWSAAVSFTTLDNFSLAPNGVTCLCPDAAIGESGALVVDGVIKTFTKRTREQLKALISADQSDPQIALTCTSGITDMSNLFNDRSSFNQDISSWDVSSVTNMLQMFTNAIAYNQPLNDWDVSNVTNMRSMFLVASAFNQPLNDWDVSSVTNMFQMFTNAIAYNHSLNDWDVSKVTNMRRMFQNSNAFNQPLNDWDVSGVTDMSSMFLRASLFNQPLDNWDVSNVIDMRLMFSRATAFDQPLNNWDVSSVTDMSAMFLQANSFNQPLNDWDVSAVTDMTQMFLQAFSFNQDLNNWDVSSVTGMSAMFFGASAFNQDISGWCVENILTEPSNFATSSLLLQDFKPRWGEDCTNATWLGTVDNNWNNPGNWKPNLIPAAGANIAINSKTFQPAIDMATTVEVNNFILLDGNTLDVSGILKIGNLFHTNGNIIFKSDTNGSGQFDTFNQSISGRGEVTVERYIPAQSQNRRAFRFLSSAVNSTNPIYDNWQESGNTPAGYGTHITGSISGANGFDATQTGNPSMFTFDNALVGDQDNAWIPVPNTDTKTLIAGEAFRILIRGDRNHDLNSVPADDPNSNVTLRAKGNLKTGNYSPSLSNENAYFSLVGNPYQAIVNFNAINFNGDINSNNLYLWNPNANTQGTYETITEAAQQMIQPGQSFFVQNSITVSTNPTLQFTEAAKNTGGIVTSVFNDNQMAIANLELYNANDLKLDVMKFRFEQGANNSIDDFDGGKLANPDENLASLNGNTLLSVERRDIPNDDDIIPLYVDQFQFSQYEFRLDVANWDDDIDVYIIDNYMNTTTLINNNQAYSFSIDSNIPESIATDRFSLSFNNTTLGVDDNSFGEGFYLYPNPTANGQFSIQTTGLSGDDVQVKMHNILGQQVMSRPLKVESNGEVNVQTKGLSAGIYMVQLDKNGGRFISKLIIK